MNFDRLTNFLNWLVDWRIPGLDIMVAKDGETVYRYQAGYKDREQGVKMQGDELYQIYSASKVVTMTAAMQLVERGLMKLSDPVSKYLPAFENLTVLDGETTRPARTVMTIEHLMSMQGGLDYELNTPAIRAVLKEHGTKTTTRQLVEALAKQPIHFDPGTHLRYSLCHDVVAAVIEVVSGKSFGEYVNENIIQPLGMKSMTFHPTEEYFDRMAACYQWDKKQRPESRPMQRNIYVLAPEYESGGAGLCGDMDSYILLADALANDGVGRSGARILTRESIDEMRRDRLGPDSKKDFDEMNKVGYSYGLGVRTLVDAESSLSPVGEFGWDGAAGAWTMADPDHHIAAFYVQHVHNCGYAFEVVHPAIRDLIYKGLDA